MKNLFTKTLLLGGLAGSLVLGGCGDKDNQKYQDFANFVVKEGKKDATGSLILNFSKDDKNYVCMYKKNISISVEGAKVYEFYHDNNLDGVLDSYDYSFEGKHNHREIFEILIDSIPKWYAESKKIKKELTEKYNLEIKLIYEELKKSPTELEKKQVYVDFVGFVKENGKKSKNNKISYFNKDSTKVYVELDGERLRIE